jgi:chorismate synthase
MASNSFGQLLRITTWGESHGKAIGLVIDGCPAGIAITEEDINHALLRRAPGRSDLTSPRKEPDCAQLYSGVYEGVTTGTPISIIIPNHDADSSPYEAMQDVLRPGHAQFTYMEKYGVFDYRGGGRASARETACRVAAGVLAMKILATANITVQAYLSQVGDQHGEDKIREVKDAGDSIGGVVSFVATGLSVGLGDPVYAKLEACLASAMLSIPASKGFEIGDGFAAAALLGSEHNDAFMAEQGRISTVTNHAGGVLGGISTGMPLVGRVAFKPTSSIRHPQASVNQRGEASTFQFPETARHDPCVALRAVPVVEAMCALVLADALLMQRCARI